MSTMTLDKRADLAGPGIGDYNDLEKVLPRDYHSPLTPKQTQRAMQRSRGSTFNRRALVLSLLSSDGNPGRRTAGRGFPLP